MAAPIYYTADMVRRLPDDGNLYEVVHGELLVTPAPQYDSLARAIAAEADHELAGALYRYRNFFEFLGSLEELGQIQRQEIYALFEYDLRMIGKDPFILAALSPQGFERLPRLLPSTGGLPAPK